MGKPKLLAVVHLPPPFHGASAVGEQFISSKLIRDSFDMRIVDLTTSRTMMAKGWRSLGRKVLRSATIQLQLFREILLHRPDLVYVTANSSGPAFWKDFMVLLVLKALNIKHCLHFHNKGFHSLDATWWGRLALRAYFAKANAIFLSERLLEDLPHTRKHIRYSICPNGVAPPDPPVGDRPTNAVPRILFVSNLIREKGVFELVDACALLKDEGLAFHCDLVGKPGDISESQLRERIEHHGLNEQVIYHGPVYGPAKGNLFRQADLFAFPTYYRKECFPLVLLEALSYGLPIVSTREGGIADIVEDGVNGFLCEQRNAHALAERIRTLLSDPSLRGQMGNVNKKQYKQLYGIVNFERNMTNCLTNCI